MENILQSETFLLDTIGDTVERFLSSTKTGVATLKEIYQATFKWPNESVRCSIYRDKKDRFKRVAKGVYLLIGQTSASLLIHGDSRKLDEIEDNSISAIINDHPWCNEKAHKSGNQKCFADYETFNYTQDDFDQKTRVLMDGGYLAEFLPVRSFSNREYLNKVEEMAIKSGLQFYTSIIWRKAPEGAINTGRTTKGVEQIVIFTKNKARCLNAGGKAYQTSNILNFEIDIPANKGKLKNHQAEKPIELYKYLLSQLSKENDICLDQFGGSCNMLKAAVDTNRFSIVYEYCKEFILKAVQRFELFTVCETVDQSVSESEPNAETIRYELETIPYEATIAQIEYLKKIANARPDLLLDEQKEIIFSSESTLTLSFEINNIYKVVNKKGFKAYCLPSFGNEIQMDLVQTAKLQNVYSQIESVFSERFPNKWLQSQYEHYKIEAKTFADYCFDKGFDSDSFDRMEKHLGGYYEFLSKNSYNADKSQKVLSAFYENITLKKTA